MAVKLDLFQAGYCTHKADVVLRDEAKVDMKFPALFALLKHPSHGYILFDTGYSERFQNETKKFPFNIYAAITPVHFGAGESAGAQLAERGILPSDISYIFISHFHADHISGLRDFPDSQFICSKKGYEAVKNKKGFAALKSAFIPNLLPPDFESRVTFIEDKGLYTNPDADGELKQFQESFDTIYDIWGDGSFLSVDLSGHAEGQFGLFFKTSNRYCFLIADAVWRSRSYREKVYPKSIAKFIMSSPSEYFKNFDLLHEFYKKSPSVFIIPSHCEEVLMRQVNLDE